MRKILMFGTMLGMATTAFAFGGVFNHGSKSTTYKGGVSAIGVHFGGEKKTADSSGHIEESCSEGVEKNTDGSCSVCANGNIYLSYMGDPCGTESPKKCGDLTENEWMADECREACECYNDEEDYCYPSYIISDDSRICQDVGTPCKSNADCIQGQEFCNLFSPVNSWQPLGGACAPLGNSEEIMYKGNKFLGSENRFSWWSAENWCKAQGKKMAFSSHLGYEVFSEENRWWDRCTKGDEDCNCSTRVLDWDALNASFSVNGARYYWLGDNVDTEMVCTFDARPDGYSTFWCGGADSNVRSGSFGGERSALCVEKCPQGVYNHNGECVDVCEGEWEVFNSDLGVCSCLPGFVWQGGSNCICPKGWHIVDGRCVECAGDETSEGNNATECVKLDCSNYASLATSIRFHQCCGEEGEDYYCDYYGNGECDCGH